MSSEVFPRDHWFKNTPENVAEFLRRFRGYPGCGGGKGVDEQWFAERKFAAAFESTIDKLGGCGIPEDDCERLTEFKFEHDKIAESVKPATKRTLKPCEYITIPPGKLEDACKEFSDVAEYVKLYGTCIAKDSITETTFVCPDERASPVMSWVTDFAWMNDRHPGLKEVQWLPEERDSDGNKLPSPQATAISDQWNAVLNKPGFYEGPILDKSQWPTITGQITWSVKDLTAVNNLISSVSPKFVSNSKESDVALTTTEMQSMAKMVAQELRTTGTPEQSDLFPKPKPSIVRKAAGFGWKATKGTANWCFAPVVPLLQYVVCVAAIGAASYLGYNGYSWTKQNIQLPTITWEAPATPSPEKSPSDL